MILFITFKYCSFLVQKIFSWFNILYQPYNKEVVSEMRAALNKLGIKKNSVKEFINKTSIKNYSAIWVFQNILVKLAIIKKFVKELKKTRVF